MNAPPLSDLIFFRIPYKLKFCVTKLITSFVLAVLHIFTVGHLLNLSIANSNWFSPFNFLLCSFPVNQFEFLDPVRLALSIFRFHFSVFDILNSYRKTGRLYSFCLSLQNLC